MSRHLAPCVLLKVALFACIVPQVTLAGKDDQSQALSSSFDNTPREIIKTILAYLRQSELQNVRPVNKTFNELATQLLNTIKVPATISNAPLFQQFIQNLKNVEVDFRQKPSDIFLRFFQNVPIKVLKLDGLGIQPQDIQALSTGFAHAPLEFLDLKNNNLGDEGAQALVLPAGLRTLNLSGCNLGDAALTAVAAKLPESLQTLWLAGGEEPLQELIDRTPSTQSGGLNTYGEIGLGALVAAIPNTSLIQLSVTGAPRGSDIRTQLLNVRNKQGNPLTIIFR